MNERLENVEIAVAHLQHDLDELNSALVQQAKDMQDLREKFRVLLERVRALTNDENDAGANIIVTSVVGFAGIPEHNGT